MTTAETVTFGQIQQLREQAQDAGDEMMEAECGLALSGDLAAITRCAQFVSDMGDDVEPPTPAERLAAASGLDALFGVFCALTAEESASIMVDRVMSRLPTFGGDAPENTSAVWSWDEGRVLIGVSAGTIRIVTREELAEMRQAADSTWEEP